MTIQRLHEGELIHDNADNDRKTAHEEDLTFQEMKVALPSSTPAERRRFLSSELGNTKAAIEKLSKYLAWKREHCSAALKDDSDIWKLACELAIQKSSELEIKDVMLPCTLFVYEYPSTNTSSGGTNKVLTDKIRRCVQFFPARVNTKLAKSSTYELAIAIFFDYIFDRISDEKVILAIDVRTGLGWGNIPVAQLLPFIKTLSKTMTDLHPERLAQCVIFPVPLVAVGLWNLINPFLDKKTAQKVHLISGPAGLNDRVPKKLYNLLDGELIHKLEETKRSC